MSASSRAVAYDATVLRGAWSRRHLIRALTIRTFQIRYRQSMVGVLWAFMPLIGTLIASTIVFDKVAKIDTGDIPYPLFALSALLPWSFFTSAIGSGVGCIAGNQMVANIPFPRSVLPFYQIGTSLMDLGVSVVVFVVYVVATLLLGQRTPVYLTALWAIPLLGLELLLIAGLVLLGSAMNAFARDVRIVLGSLLPLWLLLTPVLYPLSEVPPHLRWAYVLNPMTGLSVSFRAVLAEGNPPEFALLIPTVVWAVVFLLIGTWYFGAVQKRFSDVV